MFSYGTHHFFPGRVFGEVSRQSLRAWARPRPIWAPWGPWGPWAHMGPYGPIWVHIGPYGPIWARAHGSQTDLFWRLGLEKTHGSPWDFFKPAPGKIPWAPWGPWAHDAQTRRSHYSCWFAHPQALTLRWRRRNPRNESLTVRRSNLGLPGTRPLLLPI